MASSLAARLLKIASKNDSNASIFSKSRFKDKESIFVTPVKAINVMQSGNIDGGPVPGVTTIIGDSRTFKSGYCLANVKAFLDQKREGVVLFFDSEFGSGDLVKSYDIDEDRMVHIPFVNIEELKITMMQMLDDIGPDEDVFIYVDSVSQVASKKEVEDALAGEEKTDMTRAKSLNSLFRMVTPILTLKHIPMFVINSFYADISNKYADVIIKGGKQIFLSSDTVLFVTRSQVKKDKTLEGWDFNYSVMKSRFVKEKSKFTISVKYDGGININSSLFEWAQECGIIYSEKQGYYKLNLSGWDVEKSWRSAALELEQSFFDDVVKNDVFLKFVHDKYALEAGQFYSSESPEEIVDPATGEIIKLTD